MAAIFKGLFKKVLEILENFLEEICEEVSFK